MPSPPPALRLELRAVPRVEARLAETIRARIDHALGHWAPLITRLVLRFTDENGPRGGVDVRCTLDVHPVHLAPVHCEHRAADRAAAFAKVVQATERTLRRLFARHGYQAGRARVPDPPRPAIAPAGSLLGRREGRSAARLAMVQARPEKKVRNLWVDTARPGVSETDRVAGGGHSARRNSRNPRTAMTATLEDSLGKPSRKSTRRSANRGKPSQGKERTAVARTLTPSSRRRRAR